MGKITVKHYLNTNIKYLDRKTNEVRHPIYVQITANRKTTKIRSLTNEMFSELVFSGYINKTDNKILEYEELEKELKIITDILRYCFDYKSIEIGKHKLTEIINFYSKLIYSEFGKLVFIKSDILMSLLKYKETAPIALYLDNENNTFELIEALESVTKFNIINKLNEKQKEIIFNLDVFIKYGTSFENDCLIYWYNGECKKQFFIRTIIDNINEPQKIITNIENIVNVLENNFWIEQNNNF